MTISFPVNLKTLASAPTVCDNRCHMLQINHTSRDQQAYRPTHPLPTNRTFESEGLRNYVLDESHADLDELDYFSPIER